MIKSVSTTMLCDEPLHSLQSPLSVETLSFRSPSFILVIVAGVVVWLFVIHFHCNHNCLSNLKANPDQGRRGKDASPHVHWLGVQGKCIRRSRRLITCLQNPPEQK